MSTVQGLVCTIIKIDKCKATGLQQPHQCGPSIFFEFCRLVSAAGICIKYIILFLCLINFLIDFFREAYCSCTTIDNNSPTTIVSYKYNEVNLTETRIVVSCFMFCLMYIVPVIIHNAFTYGFKNYLNVVYTRLFHKKSVCGCIINTYSIWLFTTNLLLIALTIPNLINPGPCMILRYFIKMYKVLLT